MLVLPVPGGPHRIIDDRRPAATIRPIAPSGPVRCSWPDDLARALRGRSRSASGRIGRRLVRPCCRDCLVAKQVGHRHRIIADHEKCMPAKSLWIYRDVSKIYLRHHLRGDAKYDAHRHPLRPWDDGPRGHDRHSRSSLRESPAARHAAAAAGRGNWGPFHFDFGDGSGRSWTRTRPPGRRGAGCSNAASLRLVLLKLIADEPRHGYDCIRAIEEMTGGEYAPSPGIVYPTLTCSRTWG